jgi:putative addiction module CopG family antidote
MGHLGYTLGMNVSLTPELQAYIDAKVKTGRYNNASEVVREALRLTMDYDTFRHEVRAAIEARAVETTGLIDAAAAVGAFKSKLQARATAKA